MSRSRFNEFFGYVEFDEECDLNLLEELSMEYWALAKELGIRKYKEVSLRFRKLGQHRVLGMYYPSLKCLCVDVRAPGSMAHEVGHMIDFHYGELSRLQNFTRIYDQYENLVKEGVKNLDEKIQYKLNGRSKYNLAYYLQCTEVFARCFEIYLIRIRKINNSLCSIREGFEYPQDELLEEKIRIYFDRLMEQIRDKEERL